MEFKDALNTTSFAKVGILGFAGAGKTRTATEIAIGLHKAIKSIKPIGFIDSETGSDFVLPIYQKYGIKLMVSKTRAFKDLAEGLKKASALFDILIIDSVTHFWVDIMESYKEKKKVNRLSFQDWGIIKPMWNDDFSTPFVTSAVHIVVCGRAGFEYDYFEDDAGKMELYKTGTKMKAEGEFGFEPSLLIEMERIKNPETTEQYRGAKTKDQKTKAAKHLLAEREFVRKATVLKDRSDIMDGKVFFNPTYTDFAPHWQSINIGGEHKPLEPGNSADLFDIEGRPEWKRNQEQKKIALEEIEGELVKFFPGSGAKEKRAKMTMIETIFATKSWTKVEGMELETLKLGLSRIKAILTTPKNIKILLGEEEGKIEEPNADMPVFEGGLICPESGPKGGQKVKHSECVDCPELMGCPAHQGREPGENG